MARRARVTGVLLITALLLSACAAEPIPEWDPPGWDTSGAVQIVASETDEPADGADGAPDGAGDGAEEDPDDGVIDATKGAEGADERGSETGSAAPDSEAAALGLLSQRIRNDALSIQARWVYLPGSHAFNDRVDEIIWDAIESAPEHAGGSTGEDTGASYEPQVFDGGMSDRGCRPDTLVRPAEQLLEDPETGPEGGAGTTVVCELAGAFGPYIGVTMRVIAGDAAKIASDRRTTIYANLDTGELIESDKLWNSDAAPELWQEVMEELRRDAGSLSAAPLTPPNEEQIELASHALDAAQIIDGGEVLVTLSPGLASPELAALGVDVTDEPVQVRVGAETVDRWAALDDDLIADAVDLPFEGLPEWSAGDTHVDCALVPCIAVTYDDGPGAYTGALLDTLREHRAPATFFMVGRSMRADPDMVARVATEGHEIGSHTMQHPDLTKLKTKEMRPEVLDAAKLIEAQTGMPVTSFRPPYGAVDDKVLKAVKLPAILWTIDTLDWERPGEKLLLKRSVEESAPGDIVLFHDIHEPSVEAADPVFAGLSDRGFVPVTVTQLFDGKIPSGRVTGR